MNAVDHPFQKRCLCLFLLSVLILSAVGCAGSRATRSRPVRDTAPLTRKYTETGTACWYGPEYHGKQTASGERFDMNAMTAAHRTLPFNTKVRVTNLDNHASAVVRINDRGPFTPGRIIDVSRRAAQELGFERAGLCRCRIESLP